MRYILLSGLLALSFGLSLASCTKPPSGSSADPRNNVIRRGNIEDPETFDPALAEDIHTFNVLIDLYEGLVAEDARGQLVPGVAESWAIGDGGLSYTFKLRSTARWSNDEPVVSHDFVRAFRRAASPVTHSGYAGLLASIENFEDVKSGVASEEELGVVAIDELTLTIRLSEPSAQFLSVLAMPIAFPLYGDGSNRAQFDDPEQFVGNGAYVLVERSIGNPVILQRSTRYWNADSVTVEFIEFVAIVNEASEFNMYRTGELDITATIPTSHIDQAREKLSAEVRIAPSLALYYLAFDLTEPPLDNQLLREALSMAIDRDQLVGVLGRGEQPAYSIIPPGVANYDGPEYSWRTTTRDERIEQAYQLYNNAGYSTEKPLKLKLLYDAGGIHETVALIISSMWQESLGVVVELDKREWKYFLDTRDVREEWQTMRFSWFGDYNDASTFTDIFHSDSAQNLAMYSSAEYDHLISSAATEIDLGVRADILARAETKLINDYPIAPLYFYVSKHMVKPNILGFENNILDRHPSKYFRIN